MSNKIKGLAAILVILTIVGCGAPKKAPSLMEGEESVIVATVDGAPITEKDLMDKIKPDMISIQNEIYKLKQSGVEELIEEKLLENEAKKQGKTAEAYKEEYLAANVKEPTEEEMKEFYQLRKKKMGERKYEEVKKNIAEFLKTNKRNVVEQRLKDQLKAVADIKIKLERPRVEVEVGNSPATGPKDAKITIIDFSDYQCPFCARSRGTVRRILENYKVRYVFKDYPMSFHRDSQKAHEAAHCAGDQGKYWEMNRKIFDNQKYITVPDMRKYAKEIGLDLAEFNKCMKEEKYAERVAASVEEGLAAGVTGTPTFFINGILISGARPYGEFKEIIDAELKRIKESEK